MVFVRKGGRKGRKVMKKGAKRPAVRRGFNQKEQASLTEITSAPLVVANQNYSSYNLSLSSMTRAVEVAKGYQYYRIKRVTYVLKPNYDTFQLGGGTGSTVPYLYYMIDRTRQFQAGFTINQLKAMGAKPRRFDEKTLSFSFTPNVLTETFDNTALANGAVQYKLMPWLPTKDINAGVGVWNPNTTDHLGVVWRVDQLTGTAVSYTLERRVEIQFKKPAVPTSIIIATDVPLDFEEIPAPSEETLA